MPKYFIKTYGCQMNVSDSEVLAGLLDGAGYSESDSPETADIILVNTCCVRQKAEDKAFGYALGLVSLKMRNPKRILGLVGCVAEKDKKAIFKKLPFFDLVVGPGQEARIVQLIDEIKGGGEKLTASGDLCGGNPFRSARRSKSVQAYVTIMTGCNNFCSYCVVPFVRGKEASRPAEDILSEIRALDKDIHKEVILLGQNVNSYRSEGSGVRSESGSEELGLGKLLEEVNNIDGVERIRFMTSHPRDMSDGIIDAVKQLPKVCEYFHLPLQSGDDDILKAMNRGYTSSQYRKLIDKIRDQIPDAAITSDAIAGFPGETDRQFKNTLTVISECGLDLVNTFSYSNRPGTPASKMEGQLTEEVKKGRLIELMSVCERTAAKRNKMLEGTVQEILIEQARENKISGRTRGNKLVQIKSGENPVGKIVKARIDHTGPYVLDGEMV